MESPSLHDLIDQPVIGSVKIARVSSLLYLTGDVESLGALYAEQDNSPASKADSEIGSHGS
jgi:hypothetical protein